MKNYNKLKPLLTQFMLILSVCSISFIVGYITLYYKIFEDSFIGFYSVYGLTAVILVSIVNIVAHERKIRKSKYSEEDRG